MTSTHRHFLITLEVCSKVSNIMHRPRPTISSYHVFLTFLSYNDTDVRVRVGAGTLEGRCGGVFDILLLFVDFDTSMTFRNLFLTQNICKIHMGSSQLRLLDYSRR